jgi:hypothetical protein
LPGYLTRLFRDWRMHWSLREFFAFADSSGGAFLWDAELTPAAGAKTTEISGMDLVLLCGVRLSRNEVYFDRMALFGDGSKKRVACPAGGGIDAMNDPVRHKRLVEEHYVVFWSDVPNEMVAAQLIFEFEDHVMPAGAPRLG